LTKTLGRRALDGGFVDIEGGANRKPRFARARIAWDDDFLYIGAELQSHTSGEPDESRLGIFKILI